jgi:hypothetical protein
MNLNSKIKESAHFMLVEYDRSIDRATDDHVVANIRQQQLEVTQEIAPRVASVGKAFENIFSGGFSLITGHMETH